MESSGLRNRESQLVIFAIHFPIFVRLPFLSILMAALIYLFVPFVSWPPASIFSLSRNKGSKMY